MKFRTFCRIVESIANQVFFWEGGSKSTLFFIFQDATNLMTCFGDFLTENIIVYQRKHAPSIHGSASQLNCFENWKTSRESLFVFCLPGFKHEAAAVYKFLNLTFLWWETMKSALSTFQAICKIDTIPYFATGGSFDWTNTLIIINS